MSRFHPGARIVVVEDVIDKSEVAAVIIAKRNQDFSKQMIIGPALNGKNAVNAFNEVWDEVEVERQALAVLNPKDFQTQKEFKDKLADEAVYSDVNEWYAGMEAEKGTSVWEDLKAACTTEEIV